MFTRQESHENMTERERERHGEEIRFFAFNKNNSENDRFLFVTIITDVEFR